MAGDKSLTVKRVIKADPETIFEAMTDRKILEKWFYATEKGSATVKINPTVGGDYQIDMHGENDTYSHNGEYKEIIPNEKLVFSWNSHAVEDTVVTITLRELDSGTEVKLTHEFLPDEKMKEGHTKGWKQILENLEKTVPVAK